MRLLQHIHAANAYDLADFRAFVIRGHCYGWIRTDFARLLREWPRVFDVRAARVTLSQKLEADDASSQDRTEAVHEVCRILRERGEIPGWRDELYPVCTHFGAEPVMLMERAAVPYFGVTAYGVHMNGFVRDAGGELRMWVAQRARDKPSDPGKLDQMVAGGQPHGISLRDNMVKECAEEAGIPAELAARVRSVGALGYVLETPRGLRPDLLFNFDLELPADFQPVNRDGEVEAFFLMGLDEVVDILQDGDRFKLNCALVVIDFLLRHGVVPSDHPDYQALTAGLHPEVAPARLLR
jgi:8-oxo-dGTP pyrophosphatase MutT (NUDIX family)